MEKKSDVIKNIERAIKNNTNIEKYVKKLQQMNLINTLLSSDKYTVLMLYTRAYRLDMVKFLLESKNPADPLIKNKDGLNALVYAFDAAIEYKTYDIQIIDLLLKVHPEKQVMTLTREGSLLAYAVLHERKDLIEKLLGIEAEQQLLLDGKHKYRSPLHLAIENRDLETVDKFLKYQPELQVLQQDNEGWLPLHCALETGQLDIVKKLLQYVPEIQLKSKNLKNKTCFESVFDSKNIEIINWLFTEYPWLRREKTENGFLPLHIACLEGNLSVVKILLQSIAEEQVLIPCDEGKHIPLELACQEDCIDIVKELLNYSAEMQIKYINDLGSILHTICRKRRLLILRYILQITKDKNINITELYISKPLGITPLMVLCNYMEQDAQEENISLQMIDILLETSTVAQLEVQGMEKHTALFTAVFLNDLETVKKLTTYKCTKQYLLGDVNGSIPLFNAIKNANIDIIKFLLDRGPPEQLEIRSKNNFHALLFAIASVKPKEVIKLLLTYYNVQQLNAFEEPLLCIASEKPAYEIFLHPNVSQVFLNKLSPDGFTPLHFALLRRNWRVAQYLLEQEANIHSVDAEGWTALHFASFYNMPEAVSVLIEKGSNCEAVTNNGSSALHMAAQEGNLRVMEILLANKLDVNKKDHMGRTALLIAVLFKHIEIIELLLENKSNVNTIQEVNGTYVSPLYIALTSYDFEIAKLLLEYGANASYIISKESKESLKDYIECLFSKQPEIYEKARQQLIQLKFPHIKESKFYEKVVRIEIESENKPESNIFSSRKYLYQEVGLSSEQIEWFEEERKVNKRLLGQNLYSFHIDKPESKETITWLKGKIFSTDSFIQGIISSSSKKVYCYLDETNLLQQGCDNTKFSRRRLKFDAYHLKKMSKEKGEYSEYIKLSNTESPTKITYTHELKINAVDRILLFKLPADTGSGSLYIGIRYIAGGLHKKSSIDSLKESLREDVACLSIQWPTDVEKQQTNNNLKK